MKKAILLVFLFCSYIASAQVEPLDTDANGYRNISTLDHLRWISENDSSWSWNFELDNDIDAADTKNWNIGDHDSIPETPEVAMGWSPIGNYPIKFSGDFEGHGFKIENLYSNRPAQNLIGFFGSINYSTISGVNIINCSIKGNNVTGSLVGWNRSSDIKKCFSTGSITGVECVGGLIAGTLMGSIDSCHSDCSVIAIIYVGGLVGVNQCITTNSHSTGTVNGVTGVGGLVGESGNGMISYCYAKGPVFGIEKVGGLIGTNDYVTISYCWALGDVIGNKSIGGLIGRARNSKIKECYSVGNVKGDTAIGGLLGGDHSNEVKRCFWDKQSSRIDSSAGGIGKTTSEMKTKETFTEAGWNFKAIWAINPAVNDGYPHTNNRLIKDFKGIKPKDTDGNGFYNISLFSHLVWISQNSMSWRWNLELDKDIKADSSYLINEDKGLSSIGNYDSRFSGKFYGNGFTIDSIYIKPQNSDQAYEVPLEGLFGYISGSKCVIKDLNITNCYIQSQSYAAGLATNNVDGYINNCRVSGRISGSSAGGLVVSNSGSICNSSFTDGTVSGNQFAGGIAGYNNGVIYNSFSKGSIIGSAIIGGLVGKNDVDGLITNNYSNSFVTGAKKIIGGFVGENVGAIINCYSTGKVIGGDTLGGFLGKDNKGFAMSCFWDKETSGQDISAGGLGKTSQEMKTKETFVKAGWNLDFIWDVDSDYPSINIDFTNRPYDTDGNDYINLSTLSDLRWLSESGYDLEKKWELSNNINANVTRNWNNTSGFFPFINTHIILEGNGFAIDSLYINNANQNNFGLFRKLSATQSVIQNLGIINCSINGKNQIGGLSGYGNRCKIYNCYVSGTINGSYHTGGLIGYSNIDTLIKCHTDVTVKANNNTGGLVGYGYFSTYKDCITAGKVNGTDYVGGLIGYNYNGKVSDCYATGIITGNDYIGGLAGYESTCKVTNCYSTSNVNGHYYVGGLVGYNNMDCSLATSYATGTIFGSFCLGGLVGRNEFRSTTRDCYATGSVNGGFSVGGLIGSSFSAGEVNNCFATGLVIGNYDYGGLLGNNHQSLFYHSFWDTQTTRQLKSAGGTPKLTSEMKTKSTFTDAGWDFDNIWNIDGVTNQGYPFLQIPSVSVKDFMNLETFSLSISPNPTTGPLNINYTLTEPANTSISISNILGIEIAKISENQFQLPGSYNITYDADNLAPGAYFITVKAGNKSETKKIIIND